MSSPSYQSINYLIQSGIEHCRLEDWEQGLKNLAEVFREGVPEAKEVGLACSYFGYGMAYREGRIREGLELCRKAVELEGYQAEVYLNLARTYLLARDRRNALKAVREGLGFDPESSALVRLRYELGYRQRPPIPFLARTNPLNRFVGRLLYSWREG